MTGKAIGFIGARRTTRAFLTAFAPAPMSGEKAAASAFTSPLIRTAL